MSTCSIPACRSVDQPVLAPLGLRRCSQILEVINHHLPKNQTELTGGERVLGYQLLGELEGKLDPLQVASRAERN